MAHRNIQKGVHSQLLAATALLANGWEIAEPFCPESYDIVAKDPDSGQWKEIQVKTLQIREDRGGAIVLHARKGNGQKYSKDECDFFLGILDDGSVYLVQNEGKREYWAQPGTLGKWKRLDTAMTRLTERK